MNSKQFIAITTGTAIVSGIVGKLIGNKTCKEKMNYYKETSIKLFHSLEIKEEELNRLKQANKDQTEIIRDLTAKNEELKQTYEIQTKTIKDLVEENKKTRKEIKGINFSKREIIE
jgi:peptidoglycan hydrolase CwlO-like protein